MKVVEKKKVVDICFACKINAWPYVLGTDFALRNFLFGAIKWTKIANPDINILSMAFDLMPVKVFRYQMVVGLVKIYNILC